MFSLQVIGDRYTRRLAEVLRRILYSFLREACAYIKFIYVYMCAFCSRNALHETPVRRFNLRERKTKHRPNGFR